MAEWIHRRHATDNIRRLNLELTHDPYGYGIEFIEFWERRDKRVLLVGYIAHDEHCIDPLKNCDGMGQIITRHDDRQFLTHVGMDEDGEPILDKYVEIVARLRGVDLDGFVCETAPLREMWEEDRKLGNTPTPYAFALAFLDHQGYVEAESRGHRWKPDAVWIPDKHLMATLKEHSKEERFKIARREFECAISEHNKFAMGDTWGVVIDVFLRQDDGTYEKCENKSDACWGYVGDDYAESELVSELRAARKSLARKSPGVKKKF